MQLYLEGDNFGNAFTKRTRISKDLTYQWNKFLMKVHSHKKYITIGIHTPLKFTVIIFKMFKTKIQFFLAKI